MEKTEYIRKKNKNISCLSSGKCEGIENYFADYSQHTSLHGVRYLGEKRSLVEKVIWLSSIVASVICSSYLVWKSYEKWETSPILMTVVDIKPTEHITFPAVTICNARKFTDEFMDVLKQFSKENQGNILNITQEEETLSAFSSVWCTYDYSQYVSHFRDIDNETRKYDMNILELISNNTPTIDDLFEVCKWNNDEENCSDIFTPTFTEDGVCYTFNSLNHSDMFKPEVMTFKNFNLAREKFGFDEYSNSKPETYPYKLSPRNHTGLHVILKMAKNYSSPCMESERGHKVHIHLPNEKPRADHNNFYIQPYEKVIVDLLPELTVSHEDLRSYKPSIRNCFFDDDNVLRYFKYYTQNNCETECYSAFAKWYDNCSTYYMPHTTNMSICNSSVKRSLNDLIPSLMVDQDRKRESRDNMDNTDNNSGDDLKYVLHKCNCLDSCNRLRYNFKISCINCNQRTGVYDKDESYYHSEIKMNFKYPEISPLERRPLFGPVDFIVYCGGLLGLFIGFSLVSLLEIIYFLFFRPCYSMYLNRCKFCTERPDPPERKKLSSEDVVINLE